MGRIVLLVGLVAAISLLAVYAVSTRVAAESGPIRVPPILQQSKCWARGHDDEVVC